MKKFQLPVTIISRRKLDELESQAFTDNRTGLPNQAATDRALNALNNGDLSAAILFIDLDRLGAINKKFGHQVGNESIDHVARKGLRSLRTTDFFGRWSGGDEFVAIVYGATRSTDIAAIINRLMERFESPQLRAGDVEIPLSISVGVAFFPAKKDGSITETLRYANQAMTRSKEANPTKNSFEIHPSPLSEILTRGIP